MLCFGLGLSSTVPHWEENPTEYAIDCEATDVHPYKAILIASSYAHCPDWAFLLSPRELSKVNPHGVAISHNSLYDFSILLRNGLELQNPVDTMVAAHLMGEPELSLEALSFKFLNGTLIPVFKDIQKRGGIAGSSLEELARYSCPHAMATYTLWKMFEPVISHSYNDIFYNLEMPMIPVIAEMELIGAKIDLEKLSGIESFLKSKASECEDVLRKATGSDINFNSTQQVSRLLFNKLGYKSSRRTDSGLPSTRAEVLGTLPGLVPKKILELRKYRKLSSTYVKKLPRMADSQGRIHTSFSLTGTRTGRLSSSDPNLQNIPVRSEEGREIRKAFVPEEGCVFLDFDYNQIELRVIAHLSRDLQLIKTFLNPEGDVHLNTAMGVFKDPHKRREGKLLNFAVVYGAGPNTISEQAGIPLDTASKWLKSFFEYYSGVKSWADSIRKQALAEGEVVTPRSRRRLLDGVFSDSVKEREEALKMAVNTPAQGGAAEIVKDGQIRLHRALKKEGLKARMILQVHDEILLEVPLNERDEVFQLAKMLLPDDNFLVPMTVKASEGNSWGELKEVEI